MAFLGFGAWAEAQRLRDRLALSEDQIRGSTSVGERQGADFKMVCGRLKKLKSICGNSMCTGYTRCND